MSILPANNNQVISNVDTVGAGQQHVKRWEQKAPALRKHEILQSAVTLALQIGYKTITRHLVARESGISDGLINVYYKTMDDLRRAVMHYAIEHRLVPIVAQGIVARDSVALRADAELKKQVADYMINRDFNNVTDGGNI